MYANRYSQVNRYINAQPGGSLIIIIIIIMYFAMKLFPLFQLAYKHLLLSSFLLKHMFKGYILCKCFVKCIIIIIIIIIKLIMLSEQTNSYLYKEKIYTFKWYNYINRWQNF